MKKYLTLAVCAMLSVLVITGCGSKKEDKKKDDALETFKTVKEKMAKLDNYDYEAVMVIESGFMDVETTMTCKDDRVNKITHCTSSTMGMETEEYLDYGNQIDYSRSFGSDWTKTKVNVQNSNSDSYLTLGDYLTDYKEENKDGGKLITGKIPSSKISEALAQSGSEDYSSMISNDIDLSIFVNKDGYMEKVYFTIEVMGMKENVTVTFKNFNTAGSIELPAELK
jgi:outer membrane lipoprotein-sorting protein